MNSDELRASLTAEEPPPDLPETVQGLWHDARADRDRAHRIAQETDDADGAWVHAYLHRKEGDLSNAGYWHRRAARARPGVPLEEEWEQIVGELLR